jgi:hypothetical protein
MDASSPTLRDEFEALISRISAEISKRALDQDLEKWLNQRFPAGGIIYRELFELCRSAIAQGWMCDREAGGIRFGRVVKPGLQTHGFSVDVVDMPPIVGPHHTHPNGEIDLIMPLEPQARFDGHPDGWLVYGAGSSHHPTVTGGRTLVLYLLPGGAIEFTRR